MTQIPLFTPSSSWVPTTFSDLPDLRKTSGLIGFDTETYEPDLLRLGSQFPSGQSKVVGVSLATEEHGAFYIPFDHEGGGNLDRSLAIQYIHFMLSGDQPKVGANILYDMEALHSLGIKIQGPLNDIQIAGPLIDEESIRGYSLEVLAQQYLNEGKDEKLLDEAAAAYGVDKKSGLWRMHSKFVGPYAEKDAILPIKIFNYQYEELRQQDLLNAYQLEIDLIPVLFDMRITGVPFNVDRAEQLNSELYRDEAKILASLPFDPWSSDSIEVYFLRNGYGYPKTPKGNASFEGDFLRSHHDPAVKLGGEYRVLNKMRRDFIEHYLEIVVNGKLHPNINALRKDSEGTRSGRISMSRPNLQQVPSRDPIWGPGIRSLFCPNPGQIWARHDYSQQEPRILVHYAELTNKKGASDIADLYRSDPTTDFHQAVADMANLERKDAKGVNLGMFYGMGKKKLAAQIGRSLEEAEKIFEAYHSKVPFVKAMSWELSNLANSRGWIRTLSGRRAHFDFWEPIDNWKAGNWQRPVKTRDRALMVPQWESKILRRARTHIALNRLIQGSAADMTKKAMIDCYNEGYLPMIQVHDELNLSVESEEDSKKIKAIMENAYILNIPLIVDTEIGPSWGELVKIT